MKNNTLKRMLAGAISAAMIITSMPTNFLASEEIEINTEADAEAAETTDPAVEGILAEATGGDEASVENNTEAESAASDFTDSTGNVITDEKTDNDAAFADGEESVTFGFEFEEESISEQTVESLDDFDEIGEFIEDEEGVGEEDELGDVFLDDEEGNVEEANLLADGEEEGSEGDEEGSDYDVWFEGFIGDIMINDPPVVLSACANYHGSDEEINPDEIVYSFSWEYGVYYWDNEANQVVQYEDYENIPVSFDEEIEEGKNTLTITTEPFDQGAQPEDFMIGVELVATVGDMEVGQCSDNFWVRTNDLFLVRASDENIKPQLKLGESQTIHPQIVRRIYGNSQEITEPNYYENAEDEVWGYVFEYDSDVLMVTINDEQVNNMPDNFFWDDKFASERKKEDCDTIVEYNKNLAVEVTNLSGVRGKTDAKLRIWGVMYAGNEDNDPIWNEVAVNDWHFTYNEDTRTFFEPQYANENGDTWVFTGENLEIPLDTTNLEDAVDQDYGYSVDWAVEMEDGDDSRPVPQDCYIIDVVKQSITISGDEVEAAIEDGGVDKEGFDINVYPFILCGEDKYNIPGAESHIHVWLEESRIEYDKIENFDMLPGWDHDIGENDYRFFAQNPDYPYGIAGPYSIKSMEIIEQGRDDEEEHEEQEAPVNISSFTDENDLNVWHIETVTYGWAKVKYTYDDINNTEQTGYFYVWVSGDVYNLEFLYPNDMDFMYPDSTMIIETLVGHEWSYGEDEGYDKITGYKLSVDDYDENLISVSLTTGENGNKALKIRSKEDEGETDIHVIARWTNEDGWPEEVDSWAHVSISDSFYEIQPVVLTIEGEEEEEEINPVVGQELDISDFDPYLLWYDSSSENGQASEVDLEDYHFVLEYDENGWEEVPVEGLIEDNEGNNVFNTKDQPDFIPVLRRTTEEDTWVELVAYQNEYPEGDERKGECASRRYSFDGIDYSAWIANDENLNYIDDEGSICIFDNQNLVLSAELDGLEDLDPSMYDLRWTAGYGVEDEDGSWHLNKFDEAELSEMLETDPFVPTTVTLHGGALYQKYDENNNHYGVNIQLEVYPAWENRPVTEEPIVTDDIFVQLRKSTYEPRVPDSEEEGLARGDSCEDYQLCGSYWGMENNEVEWYIEDADHPDGGEETTALTNLTILAQTTDWDDDDNTVWTPFGDVNSDDLVAQYVDDNSCLIESFTTGRIRVKMAFEDYEEDKPDHELTFRIGFGGDYYALRYDMEDGNEEMLPTGSKKVKLYVVHHTFNPDEEEGKRYSRDVLTAKDGTFKIAWVDENNNAVYGYDRDLLNVNLQGDVLTIAGRGAMGDDGEYINKRTEIYPRFFVGNNEIFFNDIQYIPINLRNGFATLFPTDIDWPETEGEQTFGIAEAIDVTANYMYYDLAHADGEQAEDVRFIWRVESVFTEMDEIDRNNSPVPVEITDPDGNVLDYNSGTGFFEETASCCGNGLTFTVRRLQGTGATLCLYAVDPYDYDENDEPLYDFRENECWRREFEMEPLEGVPNLRWTPSQEEWEPSCKEEITVDRKAYDGEELTEYSYKLTLPQVEHEWPENGTVVVPAKCNLEGTLEFRCVKCSELLDQKSIEKLPHNYNAWSGWTETDDGREYRYRECDDCHFRAEEFRTKSEKDLESLVESIKNGDEDVVFLGEDLKNLATILNTMKDEDNQHTIDENVEADPGLVDKAQETDALLHNSIVTDFSSGDAQREFTIKIDGSPVIGAAGNYEVTISGLAASIAKEALETIDKAKKGDTEPFDNLEEGEILTYKAVAKISKIYEDESRVKLNVQVDVEDQNGNVIRKNIEPITAISLSIKVIKFIGKDIIIIHDEEEVAYSWGEEKDNVLFALPGLSQIMIIDNAVYQVELVEDILSELTGKEDISQKETVLKARAAYDALGQLRINVDSDLVKLLEAAEKSVKDYEAADKVIKMINSLPPKPDVSNKKAVQDARKAFDELEKEQKDLVTNYSKLTAAETAIKNAETADANQNAANPVISAINALPANPGVVDKAAVEAARAAYNALTADQKKLVTNIKKLEDAETSVAAAEQKAKDDAAKAEQKAKDDAAKAEQDAKNAAAAAEFSLNVANGGSVPLQVKKTSKKVKVETIANGDSLASAVSSNSNTVQASVSGNQVVLKAGKKKGSAKVTVKSAMGGEVTFTVKVQKKKVTTKSIKVAKKSISLKKGDTFDLKAGLNPITSPDNLKISVDKKFKKIVTVKNGIVTGKSKGKATIALKAGKKTMTVKVTVTG